MLDYCRYQEGLEFDIAVQSVTLASSLRMTVCKDSLAQSYRSNGSAAGSQTSHPPLQYRTQSGKGLNALKDAAAEATNRNRKKKSWEVYYEVISIICKWHGFLVVANLHTFRLQAWL